MNELGHGLSISKPSLEENVKTKKCKSFQKEMRNFQNMAFTYVLLTQMTSLKPKLPSTTSFPTAYLTETPLNRAHLLSLQFPVPSFKFFFHILLFHINHI